MNIYIGNLSPETTEDDLRQAFEPFGEIVNVNIVRDRATGQSRGFGFVAMPSESQAKTAITEMNGKDLQGNTISVEAGRTKPAPPGLRSRRGPSRGPRRPGSGRPGGFSRPGRGPGRGRSGRSGPRY